MRFAEPYYLFWARMMNEAHEPPPQETPAPTAWQLAQDFSRMTNKLDQLRRPQRRPRHQRRP